jgi:hypothetical protein
VWLRQFTTLNLKSLFNLILFSSNHQEATVHFNYLSLDEARTL